MFSALFGKEWRQLRTLRWGGLTIGLLMPWALLLVVEASHRGWLPAERVDSYSVGKLMIEIVPIMFVGLWGLLALMLAAQSFSSDRTDGTERFLLERPVPRAAVWRSRAAAGIATLSILLLVHVPYVVFLVGRVGEGVLPVPVAKLVALAGAVILCAYVGGMIAASVVGSLQAALVGIAFGALPWGLSMVLSSQYPYAFYRTISVGLVVPIILPVAYVVASYLMLCRGEPEGRGRWRRGLAVLGVASLLVPIAFVSAAPLAMRLEAGRFDGGLSAVPGPAGESLIVFGGEARTGWMIDADTGAKRRFLPQGIWDAIWNADGSRVAVIHDSEPLGARAAQVRLDVFDREGRRVWNYSTPRSIPFLANPVWSGRYLVARTYDSPRSHRFLFADVDTGEIRELRLDAPWRSTSVLGPTADGSIYVYTAGVEGNDLRSRVQRLDPETASLAEVVLEEEAVVPASDHWQAVFMYWQELSPSGRYLKRQHGIVDLADGTDLTPETSVTLAWLAEDRYARLVDGVEKRLLLGRPGEPGVELGRWDDEIVLLSASPDRERLMVQVWSGPEGRDLKAADFSFAQGQRRPYDSRLMELWIVDAASGERVDDGSVLAQVSTDPGARVSWAGPSALALVRDRSLSVRGLASDDEIRHLIGH